MGVIKFVTKLEPLLLGIGLYYFWTAPLTERPAVLWLLLPVYAARLLAYRRLWTFTPLIPFFLVLILLMILNVNFAPHTFGYALLGRPLLGMALVIGMVEDARRRQSMDGVLMMSLQLGLLLALLALGTSQWNEKSAPLQFIIQTLPVLEGVPGAPGGFNANEIGGALTFFIPLTAGVAIYSARFRGNLPAEGFSFVFALLLFALFLGQSRLSLIGVILALAALIFLLIPHNRWRYLALVALAAFTALTVYIAVDQSQRMGDRDEDSASRRVDMWISALAAVHDYPLTGIGMNTFRQPSMRVSYPVPGYERRVLPHVHNEVIQVAVDLGIPGLLVFIGWNLAAVRMVWQTWRRGDAKARAVVLAAAAGVAAHAVFGLGDAITLWDRFAFLHWWLLGIIAAQFVLLRPPSASSTSSGSRGLGWLRRRDRTKALP